MLTAIDANGNMHVPIVVSLILAFASVNNSENTFTNIKNFNRDFRNNSNKSYGECGAEVSDEDSSESSYFYRNSSGFDGRNDDYNARRYSSSWDQRNQNDRSRNTNYNRNGGYGSNNGYNSNGGYGSSGSYGSTGSYDMNRGYRTNGGYGSNRGYGSNGGFESTEGYGSSRGHRSNVGYGSNGYYGSNGGYGSNGNYGQHGDYSPHRGYGSNDGYGSTRSSYGNGNNHNNNSGRQNSSDYGNYGNNGYAHGSQDYGIRRGSSEHYGNADTLGNKRYGYNSGNSDNFGYHTSYLRRKRSDEDNECTSQCVFGYLEVLDENRSPSESALIKWFQDHMPNDGKRIKALRETRRCFGQISASDNEDGCEFSKSLSRCLNLDIEK